MSYVCLRIVVSNTYCVGFFSSSCAPNLQDSLDCPFFIATSVFSSVYLPILISAVFYT